MTKADYDFLGGEILLLDKPLEWSSFDVVKKIRNAIGIKKVGHAGTLDPLATGLLIICTGKATKRIEAIQSQEKVYTGTIVLGQETASFDLESEPFPAEPRPTQDLEREQLNAAATSFVGAIEQVPPKFSAVKVDGKRAYELARKGKEVEIKSRQVHIHEFSIGELKDRQLSFTVRCSKGTYIRSLAHDFGQKLGVGGYLSSLRREAIGDYQASAATGPEELATHIKSWKHAGNHHA